MIAAEFASYRQAQEAANKLLAIRAEGIGIALAASGSGKAGSAELPPAEDGGGDAEFAADGLPRHDGGYRLTAAVRPETRALAERIIRACGGRETGSG